MGTSGNGVCVYSDFRGGYLGVPLHAAVPTVAGGGSAKGASEQLLGPRGLSLAKSVSFSDDVVTP